MLSRFLTRAAPVCKPRWSQIRGWLAGAGILFAICPLNTALSSFQVFIQGGCVKYYDRSPLSPASVASRGRDWLRLHMQVALVTWKARFREEKLGTENLWGSNSPERSQRALAQPETLCYCPIMYDMRDNLYDCTASLHHKHWFSQWGLGVLMGTWGRV